MTQLLANNPLCHSVEATVGQELHTKFCVRPHPIDLPDGTTVLTRCGTRFHDQCPSCAEQTRGDWSRILRSGAVPSEDLDIEALQGYRFMFLTLTQPSFGHVHDVPAHHNSKRRKCKCGIYHNHADEDLRGAPIDEFEYEYDEQILWNMATPILWHNTRRNLDYLIPGFAFAAVREWQSRGALHLHILIRFKDQPLTVSGVQYRPSAQQIIDIAKGTTAKMYGLTFHWGEQVDCQEVATFDEEADRMEVVKRIGYLAKTLGYAAKDWGNPYSGKVSSENSPLALHHKRLKDTALAMPCQQCQDEPFQSLLCTAPVHTNYGAAGHPVTVSRGSKNRDGWSLADLSRSSLKAERIRWAQENLGDLSEEAQDLRNDQYAMVLCWWNRTKYKSEVPMDYLDALPKLGFHLRQHSTRPDALERLVEHYVEQAQTRIVLEDVSDLDEPEDDDNNAQLDEWLAEIVTRPAPPPG